MSKIEKAILINIPDPQYEVMINQFQHLKDIQMNDTESKSSLPIHLFLGASELSKIKVKALPRIGQLRTDSQIDTIRMGHNFTRKRIRCDENYS